MHSHKTLCAWVTVSTREAGWVRGGDRLQKNWEQMAHRHKESMEMLNNMKCEEEKKADHLHKKL